MRPAVFLDRDDTLILNRSVTAETAHPGSLFDPGLVRLVPGGADACGRLAAAGFALVVVTNQGCVARGQCGIAEVEATNDRVRELVRAETHGRAEIAAVYYCPHHPKGTVPPYAVDHWFRKPHPGMIVTAAKDLGLDLARSWMVGDTQRDIDAALAAGIDRARTLLVGDDPADGFGRRVADLAAAAEVVLATAGAATGAGR